jgi:hypothetical protein
MKFNFICFFLVLMFSTTVRSQEIMIHRTNEEVIIDGELSEWKAPFLGPFVVHNSGTKASQDTSISFLWNNEYLYVAYRCIDFNIIGNSKNRDSEIYKTDDLVELFIDPDGDGQNYIEIGANAYSTYYDMLIKCIIPICGGWNSTKDFNISGLEAASKITSEGFCTEIKIPFSSLAMIQNGNFNNPKVGTKWKGNAFRIDYGNSTEYLSLQHYKSKKFGFHQPDEFIIFKFVE